MTVRDIYTLIDSFAPFSAQEEFDNSGLLIGSYQDPVHGILFALDLSEAVIDEAIALQASLIVTHHPVMFSPRRTILDTDYEGRLISRMIRHHLSLIAVHTNLDKADGGINDVLAALCGLSSVSGEGFIRTGTLTQPASVEEYTALLSESLACTVRVFGTGRSLIRRVGVSSGSGGDNWESAFQAGCDAFVTGEMKHHLALAAADAGMTVFECGHFATESPGLSALAEALQTALNTVQFNLGVFVSEVPAYCFPKHS